MDPFQPIQVPSRNVFIKMIEIVLMIIKLPLFLTVVTEIIIINDLIFGQLQKLNIRQPQYKHQSLHKSLRVIVLLHNYFMGRLLLLILGYFKYKSLLTGNNPEYKQRNLQSYCFYCTRTSPVDVFFYITYFSPSFTECSISKNAFKVKIISYFQAIYDSFFIGRCGFKKFADGITIQDAMSQIIDKRTGPLIIFLEGGITNACSFLKIDPIIMKEMEKITNAIFLGEFKKTEYYKNNPQAFLSIILDDVMNLIGNSPLKMLYKLLTHSFSNIDMFFTKFPLYPDSNKSEQKYIEKYKEFVETKLQRGLCDNTWKDFRKRFVIQNN